MEEQKLPWSMRMEIPHERYAKMLIYNKVGYSETMSVKDCFDLMLEFGKLEKQLADEWEKIATDALALKPCSPMLLPVRKLTSKGDYTVSYEFLHQLWHAVGEVPQGVNAIQQGCYEKCRDAYTAINRVLDQKV